MRIKRHCSFGPFGVVSDWGISQIANLPTDCDDLWWFLSSNLAFGKDHNTPLELEVPMLAHFENHLSFTIVIQHLSQDIAKKRAYVCSGVGISEVWNTWSFSGSPSACHDSALDFGVEILRFSFLQFILSIFAICNSWHEKKHIFVLLVNPNFCWILTRLTPQFLAELLLLAGSWVMSSLSILAA